MLWVGPKSSQAFPYEKGRGSVHSEGSNVTKEVAVEVMQPQIQDSKLPFLLEEAWWRLSGALVSVTFLMP